MVTNRNRKSFGSRRQKKKFQMLLRRMARLKFLIRVQIFRDPHRGELPHDQIFMNDGHNPLTWDTQLLSYWFSRSPPVFKHYLMNMFDNLRSGHCCESSRTRPITGGKITTFKLGHTVFDGDIRWWMFTLCLFQNGVNFLWGLALQKNKKHTSRCCWNRARRLTCSPLNLCNKKRLAIRHMNRPLIPTTLSIPSFNIGN